MIKFVWIVLDIIKFTSDMFVGPCKKKCVCMYVYELWSTHKILQL